MVGRKVSRTRTNLVVGVGNADRDRAPLPIYFLIGRRVGQQIAVLHVRGEGRVHQLELPLAAREKCASTRFLRQRAEEALPFQRDPRHAPIRDHIDRRLRGLDGLQRLVEAGLAMLVVPVGNQDNGPAPFDSIEVRRHANKAVQNRSPAMGFDVPDGLQHGGPVVGWSGDRLERFGKRHDHHAVAGAHEADESPCGLPDEVNPARHALTAVDEHRKGRRLVLFAGKINRLWNTVLTDLEVAARQRSDESARLVLNRGIHEHASHFRDLGDFERLQEHAVARGIAATVGDGNCDLVRIERVGIVPGGRAWRFGNGRQRARVDPELHRAQRRTGKRVNLRHDADDSGLARPSQRRRDSNRQGRGRVGGTGVIGRHGDGRQNDRHERAKLHSRVRHRLRHRRQVCPARPRNSRRRRRRVIPGSTALARPGSRRARASGR